MVNTKIRVVNKVGKDVEKNGKEKGEVILKGSSVLNNDETKHTTIDGWLYTGDIGTMDEHGKIKVVSDKQDMQNSNGNSSSTIHEVERACNSHPYVLESAVIPVPHIENDEMLQAFIVLHPDQELTKSELIDFLRKKLNQTILIKIIITFLEKLPRTTSGKILKLQLYDK